MSYFGNPDAVLLSQSVFWFILLFPSVLTMLVQPSHKKVMLTLALSIAILMVEAKTTARRSLFSKRYLRTSQCLAVRELCMDRNTKHLQLLLSAVFPHVLYCFGSRCFYTLIQPLHCVALVITFLPATGLRLNFVTSSSTSLRISWFAAVDNNGSHTSRC